MKKRLLRSIRWTMTTRKRRTTRTKRRITKRSRRRRRSNGEKHQFFARRQGFREDRTHAQPDVQQPGRTGRPGEAESLDCRQHYAAGHRQGERADPQPDEWRQRGEVLVMPNDQFGRPVAVGDKVLIKGSLVAVEDNPNYLNCTVKLEQAMPPSGAETQLKLNTVQLEKAGPPKAQ